MDIKITGSSSDGRSFSYGRYTKEQREFLQSNIGGVFKAKRDNINYYRLVEHPEIIVHLYEAMEE